MSATKAGSVRRSGLVVISLAVFLGYTGQQVLTPVLPPLARELSLTEFQYGLLVSASALLVAVTSPLWGRCVDRWGARPVLLGAALGAALGLGLFTAVLDYGLRHLGDPTPVFYGLLISRGVLFGVALAALPVAAQSYVASVTPTAEQRVAGIARIGATIGLALVLGPGVGGLLARVDVVGGLYGMVLLLLLGAVALGVGLPRRQPSGDAPADASHPASDPPPEDTRDVGVWPLLVTGAGIYLSTSLLQVSLAFLVQDRLGLDTSATMGLAGLALLVGGLPMLVVQGLVIPRLGWSALRLVRAGLGVAALGFAALALAPTGPLIVAATALAGLGHSLAIPGNLSALSLRFGPRRQGRIAGIANSANAVGLVAGPILAVLLYDRAAGLPFVIGAVVLTLLCSLLSFRKM
ncbi:MFS transporter [Spiractinospora alimapuensis]|uniref:MFS transporter n=1 Tax=Spiractinospora alimapuensis TaxID=2820884 RepID=UPI001F219016|nr:MFS transporter [Spiractinospora alimapuensis]QVQ52339.1 MFS transporter [Spiractinospora alimapuensis]